MSTSGPADTPPLRNHQAHKQEHEQRSTTVDYLDLRTTEERASSEDAAYADALALLDEEGL